MRKLSRALWLVPLLLGWAGSARADAVAVFGVEAVDVPEAQANQLTEALREKAKTTPGVRLVPSKDFVEVKMLYGCMDPQAVAACVAPAGKSIGAEKMVIGSLSAAKRKKKVHVTLKLVDVATGQVVKFVDEEVAAIDLGSDAGRWFAALVPASAPPPPVVPPPTDGQLFVTSEPAGANVYLDGRLQSPTPYESSAKAGKHTVELVKDGFQKETREIAVRAGEPTRVDVTLTPIKPKPPEVAQVKKPEERKDLVPPPLPPQANEHPGRTAMIVGSVVLAVALLDGGIAIYTFKHYSDLQDTAHGRLDTLRSNAYAAGTYTADNGMTMTGQQWVDGNSGFFRGSPSCDVPAHGPPVQGFSAFVDACKEGERYATITTVLDIGLGVLAAIGVTSLGVGLYQSTHAAERPKATLAPRLRLLSPVVTRSGGGLSAAFEF